MARVTFDSIFIRHQDGSLEPQQRIRVGGIEFGPGVKFTNGAAFGGINFFDPQIFNHDLEITTNENVVVINGIF